MAAVGHMFNHYARKEGDNVQRGNEKIKPELTHLNYNLAPVRTKKVVVNDVETEVEMSQMDYLNQRLSEVVQNRRRKDINVMADWVVTLPQDVPEDKAKEFFQAVYDFNVEKYGEENVISAWVHMDETTPHIHIALVPAVKDENGTERLCAKECISRAELMQYHPALQKYVEEKMQIAVGILNGATDGGNLTILQLKARSALEELAAYETKGYLAREAQPVLDKGIELFKECKSFMEKLMTDLKTTKGLLVGGETKAKAQKAAAKLDEIESVYNNTQKLVEDFNKAVTGFGDVSAKKITANLKQSAREYNRAANKAKREISRQRKAVKEREKTVDTEIKEGIKDGVQEYIKAHGAEIDERLTLAARQRAARLDEENKRKAAQLQQAEQAAAAAEQRKKAAEQGLAALNTQLFFAQQPFLQQAQRNQDDWQKQFNERINRYDRTDD